MSSPAASLVSYPCSICRTPTSMWCSRCQAKWYCTPEHLQKDWPRHRHECAPVNTSAAGMIMTPSPVQVQSMVVEAILFPPDEDRPRIVNVECRPPVRSSQACPSPNLASFFPEGQPDGLILTIGLNGELMRFPLHLFYCPTSMQRRSPPNRAIYKITSGAAKKAWFGPVIVLKFTGARRQGYMGAGSHDLPALSAYFLNFE